MSKLFGWVLISVFAGVALIGCTRQLNSPTPAKNPVLDIPSDQATLQAIGTEISATALAMPNPLATFPVAPPPTSTPQVNSTEPAKSVAPTLFSTGISGIGGRLRAPNRGQESLALRITAINLDTGQIITQDTQAGQEEYAMTVPAGRYHVVGYWLDGGGAAGYTAAVVCGMKKSCSDHFLAEVIVLEGQLPPSIDLFDWEIADSIPARP
jgi:hypothetical protein